MPTIRAARASDDAALARIDQLTWTSATSPSPVPPPGTPFARPGTSYDDLLVAEVDGQLAGYVKVHQAIPLPSHEHVLELGGLAVDPAHGRQGLGRLLVKAACDEARRRGARKLSLRVLGPNAGARALYEACGFRVEGVLRGEFLLDGQYVDDVLMAREL